MKFPDLFYLNKSYTLDRLHDISIELLEKFFDKNNPNNAYDTEWGRHKIQALEITINSPPLNDRTIRRLLRQRLQSTSFSKRPELDRDILRLEHIIQNIEQEQALVFGKQMQILAWINAIAWVIILTALFWYSAP